ncbi:TRAM domain-containing protein [Candidatus Woesearchaeota archaeon]|nr:TRAM domain-containing protein [Candidatus Woesearchaeota archaeon]
MERQGFRSFAPVKVGDELDVKIEAVGEKGDGIAKIEGFVLFIPGVKEGDEVRIRVNKVLRKVGFADVVGEAQGPVGEGASSEEAQSEGAPAEQEAAPEEEKAPAEEAAEQKAEETQAPPENPEDTEDFGEEEKQE